MQYFDSVWPMEDAQVGSQLETRDLGSTNFSFKRGFLFEGNATVARLSPGMVLIFTAPIIYHPRPAPFSRWSRPKKTNHSIAMFVQWTGWFSGDEHEGLVLPDRTTIELGSLYLFQRAVVAEISAAQLAAQAA